MLVLWARFPRSEVPTLLNLGVGVTARSLADARALIGAAFEGAIPVELQPVEDVATLDAGHVRPNMGNIFQRGIWFPLGYESISEEVR